LSNTHILGRRYCGHQILPFIVTAMSSFAPWIVGGIIIAIIIIMIVVFAAPLLTAIRDFIKSLFNFGSDAIDIINPANWFQGGQSASLCCDVYTAKQLETMIQHQCLSCQDCSVYADRPKTPQHHCSVSDDKVARDIDASGQCRNLLTKSAKMQPQILACDGWVTTVNPVQSNNSTPYLGCFADRDDRALVRSVPTATTWDECLQTARTAGAKYFALQYGEGSPGDGNIRNKAQCVYGNSDYSKYGPADCPYRDGAGHVIGKSWTSAVYGTGY
jgi:hypothetical protein